MGVLSSRGQGYFSSSRGEKGGGGTVEVLGLLRRLLVLLSSICNQRETPKNCNVLAHEKDNVNVDRYTK